MSKFKSSTIRNLLTLALVFALVFGTTVPTFAATTPAPYGFTYDDTAEGKTMYKFYKWSSKEDSYLPTRVFYSKGNYVFTSAGVLVCNTSIGNGSYYNGFDSLGNFYVITKSGALNKVDTNNKVTVLLTSGAIKLNYNTDDIATTVKTTTGSKSLPTLANVPETDDDDTYNPPTVAKQKNRVDMYTNSAGELVYEAFYNNKLKTQIVVRGTKVVNTTAKVRLTDILSGAKFVGFDTSYNVYLYEKGILYRFKSGSWYSAERLSLSGTYKSFKKDSNGFISKVVTTKSSYTIKQLTTSSKWKASKTYAVRKSGYVTLYSKGSSRSNTLTLKSSKLSLNGKLIATGVKYYGFTPSKKIIYLKNGSVYTAYISKPKSPKKFCSKARSLYANSIGLVTKVTLNHGSKKVA